MIETNLALPHRVNRTRYPVRISHMVKRKAVGQWRSWLSAVIIGMNESPHAKPYIIVVMSGLFVIFISMHLLWSLPCV